MQSPSRWATRTASVRILAWCRLATRPDAAQPAAGLRYSAPMRLLKLLLVWTIVLAIPAQGMAAAALQFCGPGHHRMQAAVAHAQQASHHHDDIGEAAVSDVAASKCSACGSCCTPAALFNEFPVLPEAVLVSAYQPPAPVAVVTGITDGLERPPRPVLA